MVIRTHAGNTSRSGFRLFGQSALTDARFTNTPDQFLRIKNGLFHHYGMTAGGQAGAYYAGATVDYQREARYGYYAYTHIIPPHLDRLRVQAHAGWKGKGGNGVRLQVLGSPQQYRFSGSTEIFTPGNVQHRAKERVVNGSLQWNAVWRKRFRNELALSYDHYKLRQQENSHLSSPFATSDTTKMRESRFKTIQIRNSFRTEVQAGQYHLKPGLDLFWAAPHYPGEEIRSGILLPVSPNYEQHVKELRTPRIYVTPSADLELPGKAYLTLGFQADLADSHKKRLYPFAALKLTALNDSGTGNGLHLYASYAAVTIYRERNMVMQGLDYQEIETHIPVRPDLPNTPWQGAVSGNSHASIGAQLQLMKSRLTLSYHWSHQFMEFNFHDWPGLSGTSPQDESIWKYWHASNAHRIALTGRILQSAPFAWTTHLHANYRKSKVSKVGAGDYREATYWPEGYWTGGWTHTLRYRKWKAGIYCMYSKGVTKENRGLTYEFRLRKFGVNSGFLSFTTLSKKGKELQMFANLRNDDHITEKWSNEYENRLFGLGASLTL
ncbi:MAG TPA: hypothetical protein VHK69_02320 [Chitinophagaceae bacterium]|nr:hypothetical protein [Chitinophagaceae bacterium]